MSSFVALEGRWLPNGGAFVFLIESSGLEAEVDSPVACLPYTPGKEGLVLSCLVFLIGHKLPLGEPFPSSLGS